MKKTRVLVFMACLMVGALGCDKDDFPTSTADGQGTEISGEVRDAESGRLISTGVKISIKSQGSSSTEEPVGTADTDFTGKFTIKIPDKSFGHQDGDDVPNTNTYEISAEKSGFETEKITRSISLGQTEVVNFLLEEATGSLGGQVTDKETKLALSGVQVSTIPATSTVTTDAGGIYNISAISARSYIIIASKAEYTPVSMEKTVTKGSALVVDISLKKAMGNLIGQVTDEETGLALSGVQVSTIPATSTVTTDAEGVYNISSIQAGDYTVIASNTGYTLFSEDKAVTENSISKMDIRLKKATGSLEGQVTDKETKLALSGVQVSTIPATSTVTTDVGGVYNISAISARSYTIIASKAAYTPVSMEKTVTTGVASVANFELSKLAAQTGNIKGLVTDSVTGNPLVGVRISTNPIDPSSGAYTTDTDANGEFELKGVDARMYSLNAVKAGYASGTVSVTVDADLTAIADITLAKRSEGVTLSGQVRSIVNAAAVQGVRISNTSDSQVTFTDAMGNFTLSNLNSETTSVITSKQGFKAEIIQIDLTDKTAETIDIYLTPDVLLGTIVGTVVDSSGTPIDQVLITTEPVTNSVLSNMGSFTMMVPEGDYTVKAARAGYDPTQVSITVKFDQNTNASLILNKQ